MTTDLPHIAQWKARAADLGLTYYDDNPCPRALVDRAHLDEECWCTSRAKDHAATWTEADGTRVVLWEPYDLDPPELARLHLSAAREGLAVFVSGHSPWNPGATLAVTFTKKRR